MLICGDLCNLGDLALLMQNLGQGSEEGRTAFVRQWGPTPREVDLQAEAAGARLVRGKQLFAFVSRCTGCDMVIGGGQLVRDNGSIPSLLFLLIGAAATRLGGGRVQARGLGISRCRSRMRRVLWRAVFSLCGRVVVRDEQSLANGRTLTGREMVMATDMAFLPGRLHQLTEAAGTSMSGRIVISPCIDLSEGRSIEGPRLGMLLTAARRAAPGAEICIACHDPREGMDRAAAERLQARPDLQEAKLIDGYDLRRLLAEYAAAKLVITNRLHAIIFSLLLNKPVVAIDDGTNKTMAICRQFAVPVVDVRSAAACSNLDAVVSCAVEFDRPYRQAKLREAMALARLNLA